MRRFNIYMVPKLKINMIGGKNMTYFLKNYDGVLLMLIAGGVTILIKSVVAYIYTGLLHQAQQISTTKNKWMRNMVCKYETTYKMNLKINDTKSMILIQMKDVKYAGISLYNLKNTGIYGVAFTGIIYAVYMIGGFYEKFNREWYIKMSAVMLIIIFAIWVSELFLQLNQKDELLEAQLYDYLENILEPHLSRGVLQTKNQDAGEKKEKLQTADYEAVEENKAEKKAEISAEKNGKIADNEYGQEELELFQEVMEGIYGEEI